MRKNFLLISFIFTIISANINSQEYYEGEYEFAFGEIQIAEGLTLYVNEDGYRIEYLVINYNIIKIRCIVNNVYYRIFYISTFVVCRNNN